MNLLRLIVKVLLSTIVGLTVFTVYLKVRQTSQVQPGTKSAAPADQLSPNGFFLLNPAEASNQRVVIMTPQNCPSQQAAHARALAAALQEAGVPTEMRSDFSASFTDEAEAERVNRHMSTAEVPIVIVRGWAKGSPTLDQVIAEYKSGRR